MNPLILSLIGLVTVGVSANLIKLLRKNISKYEFLFSLNYKRKLVKLSLKKINITVAIIIYGPKGISDDICFDLFIKLGITETNAIKDDRKTINGIDIQPNQNPMTANSFASPKPIPSFFLICL